MIRSLHFRLFSIIAVSPERIWKWAGHRSRAKVWGGTDPAQSAGKIFWSCPPLFGSKSTVSRFGERFRDGQYSLVSFLFAVLLLTVPPCPAICKSGGTCPPFPRKSAPLHDCI